MFSVFSLLGFLPPETSNTRVNVSHPPAALVVHACDVVLISVQQGAILVKGHMEALTFQGFSSRLNIQKMLIRYLLWENFST